MDLSMEQFYEQVARLHISPGAMIPCNDPRHPTLEELEDFARAETRKTAAVGASLHLEGFNG